MKVIQAYLVDSPLRLDRTDGTREHRSIEHRRDRRLVPSGDFHAVRVANQTQPFPLGLQAPKDSYGLVGDVEERRLESSDAVRDGRLYGLVCDCGVNGSRHV